MSNLPKMTDKLKPCPFCGQQVDIVKDDDIYLYRVRCNGTQTCPIFIYTDTEEDAIKAWNTRCNKGVK